LSPFSVPSRAPQQASISASAGAVIVVVAKLGRMSIGASIINYCDNDQRVDLVVFGMRAR